MKVRLSPGASSYVKAEASYLRLRSPSAAQRFADNLKRLKHSLTQFPQIGQVADDLPVPDVFRFVMGDYLVDYQIKDGRIEILAIRHGHQRPPGLALEDDFDFEDIESRDSPKTGG